METNTTLQFIGTILIPLITALAGWIAGSRKRNNNFLQALIRCDSTGRARLEEINTLKQTQAQHLQQTLTITPDPQPHQPTPITLITTIDSMGIYLTYKEHHHQTTQTQTIETIIEKQVNILKWWQKGLMWIGGASLLILWIRFR